jgi:MFS family permease
MRSTRRLKPDPMTKRVLILATGESGDDQITPLQSPVPDGERLRDLLRREDVGGYDVRLVPNPSLVAARMAIEDFFGDAKADDTLILLITGHGMRDDGMRLFFATADSRQDRVRSTSLAARFVLEERDCSLAARKILMFDTCHAGSYAKGHVNKSAQSGFLADDFDTAAEGTAVLTASSARQSAREAEVDGVYQSHFTRLLIEGIQTGAADPQGTGEITLDQLFAYIRSGLRRDSPGQTPSIEMKGALGSFSIARNPAWQKPQLSDELQEAVNSPNRVSRRGAVSDLVELFSTDLLMADAARGGLLLLLRDADTTVSQAVVQTCKRHGIEVSDLYEGAIPKVYQSPAVKVGSRPQSKLFGIFRRGAKLDNADIAQAGKNKWQPSSTFIVLTCVMINTILSMDATLWPSLINRYHQEYLSFSYNTKTLGIMIAGIGFALISVRFVRQYFFVCSIISASIAILITLIFSDTPLTEFGWLWYLPIGTAIGIATGSTIIIVAQAVPKRQRSFSVAIVAVGHPVGLMLARFQPFDTAYSDGKAALAITLAFITAIFVPLVLLKFPRDIETGSLKRKINFQQAVAGTRLRSSIFIWMAIICLCLAMSLVFSVVPHIEPNQSAAEYALTDPSMEYGYEQSFDKYAFSGFYGIGACFGAVAIAFACRLVDSRKLGGVINSVAAIVFFALYGVMFPLTGPEIAGFLTGMLLVGGFNTLYVVVIEIYPEEARPTGLGWAIAASAIGLLAGQLIGMLVSDISHLPPLFVFMAFCVPLFIAALAVRAVQFAPESCAEDTLAHIRAG